MGVFRLLEGAGRKLSTGNRQRSPSASQAAAIASAVALTLLEAERKTIVVSYAVVEATLILVRNLTTLADVKYIGNNALPKHLNNVRLTTAARLYCYKQIFQRGH